MTWLLAHSWHLLGLGPLALILAAIFAWPVVGPILARRPWIAVLAAVCLTIWIQEVRIKALKSALESAKAATADLTGKMKEQNAAVETWKANAAAQAQATAAADAAAAAQATAARQAIDALAHSKIPADCNGAVKWGTQSARDAAAKFKATP